MKQSNCIALILCLIAFRLSAQSWTIDYLGEYPSGSTHLSAGFVDKDGVTFLAGYAGPDKDHPESFFMRIEPDGGYTTLTYHREGALSKATSVVETDDHRLFVAGNLRDDTDDYVMILVLDKQLQVLEEHLYEKEVEALSFGDCVAAPDSHGRIIVATSVEIVSSEMVTNDYGVLFKFDANGQLLSRRYLIEDYPNPLFFIKDFHLRQMWYKDDETLLCLAPGYGGVMSFITFDSAFNYVEEHQIWREDPAKSDHTLHLDCYTDHWYSEEDALFFSSRGDYDHNDLRISRINVWGEYLDYIHLTQTPDTIYDPAFHRCMAKANDSTFYFSFWYHTLPVFPGKACVYQINEQLEVVGSYLKDDCDNYRAALILPTTDNGCIVVNHFSPWTTFEHYGHPYIERLTADDFQTCPTYVIQKDDKPFHEGPYPNPADRFITLPTDLIGETAARCQIIDSQGRTVIDRKLGPEDRYLLVDLSALKPGIYHYRIYTQDKTLLTEKFVKR